MSSITLTYIFTLLICFLHTVHADGYMGAYIGGGIGGLIIFVLDLIAIFDILKSERSILGKLLWVLLILLFPVGGLIIWLLCGRKTSAVA